MESSQSHQSHYERYKETTKACSLKYYYANREARLEANRVYRNQNKERIAQNQRDRRARAKAVNN
jgi:hypothetical protein